MVSVFDVVGKVNKKRCRFYSNGSIEIVLLTITCTNKRCDMVEVIFLSNYRFLKRSYVYIVCISLHMNHQRIQNTIRLVVLELDALVHSWELQLA